MDVLRDRKCVQRDSTRVCKLTRKTDARHLNVTAVTCEVSQVSITRLYRGAKALK